MLLLYQSVNLLLLEINFLVQGVDSRFVKAFVALLLNYLANELHDIVPLRINLRLKLRMLRFKLRHPVLDFLHQACDVGFHFLSLRWHHCRKCSRYLQWQATQLIVDHLKRRVTDYLRIRYRLRLSRSNSVQILVWFECWLLILIHVEVNVCGEHLTLIDVLLF